MEMIKPRALREGDRIGLAAPSGSLKDFAQAETARRALEGLGFRVEVGGCCTMSYGYLAGGDEARAAELNGFFADPAIAGIVCLKGGYGTPRILDRLDYGLIKRNPKVFVGYSDITAIHLALGSRCGLVTFHGPMGISDVILEGDPYSTASWLAAVTGAGAGGAFPTPVGSPAPRSLRGGKASGPITGGNLSLIAATMGTAWEIDARGCILFLEDVDERPYRVDRMLTQLRLAGKLDDCAGIVLGDWKRCDPEEGKPSLSLEEIFRDVILPSGKPTISGFPAGHCSPSLTIPFGVRASLDADVGSLRLDERALEESADAGKDGRS